MPPTTPLDSGSISEKLRLALHHTVVPIRWIVLAIACGWLVLRSN